MAPATADNISHLNATVKPKKVAQTFSFRQIKSTLITSKSFSNCTGFFLSVPMKLNYGRRHERRPCFPARINIDTNFTLKVPRTQSSSIIAECVVLIYLYFIIIDNERDILRCVLLVLMITIIRGYLKNVTLIINNDEI